MGAESLREPPVRAIENVDGAVVVRLTGELDLHDADEIRAALVQAATGSPRRIVVDLSHVEFVDSTVLGVLIEARSRIGTSFALAAPQHETRRTLQVSGLDRQLAVRDSVEDALSA
jgi:anti-sigma B factor antagonist